MMRTLLIGLAVVIAVLAFVLDQVWLYWAAGALLVAGVVVIVTRMWQRYQEAVRFRQNQGATPRHPELDELGILEVRPRSKEPETKAPSEEAVPSSSGSMTDAREKSTASSEAAASEPTRAESTKPKKSEKKSKPEKAVEASETGGESVHPVFGPYLQALRAATDGHSACLLVQEDVMLTYRIMAAASRSADVHTTGAFETDAPLLSARMSQQAITVQLVGKKGVDPALLGYYVRRPTVEQVAFAPVPTPSAASNYFLVVDATDTHLQQQRAKKIITHFADLLGVLIEAEETPDAAPASPAAEDDEPAKPRPRREIIAEEINEAKRTSTPLALALVHLNRAEKLAGQGKDVVHNAESTLRARLERSAPRSRVERFGELTFGVFYNGDVVDVEPWAERLQAEMANMDGLLTGGVSIGVAMLREETQSPEALREDATEALWMAYETGTCTIVE